MLRGVAAGLRHRDEVSIALALLVVDLVVEALFTGDAAAHAAPYTGVFSAQLGDVP